jgi:hypothetical protein
MVKELLSRLIASKPFKIIQESAGADKYDWLHDFFLPDSKK